MNVKDALQSKFLIWTPIVMLPQEIHVLNVAVVKNILIDELCELRYVTLMELFNDTRIH